MQKTHLIIDIHFKYFCDDRESSTTDITFSTLLQLSNVPEQNAEQSRKLVQGAASSAWAQSPQHWRSWPSSLMSPLCHPLARWPSPCHWAAFLFGRSMLCLSWWEGALSSSHYHPQTLSLQFIKIKQKDVQIHTVNSSLKQCGLECV